jgi:hypothetical protein
VGVLAHRFLARGANVVGEYAHPTKFGPSAQQVPRRILPARGGKPDLSEIVLPNLVFLTRNLAPRSPSRQERQEKTNQFYLGVLGFLAVLARAFRLRLETALECLR